MSVVHWRLLRVNPLVRSRHACFSSSAASAAMSPESSSPSSSVSEKSGSGSTGSSVNFPTRHSRSAVPPACLSIAQLNDLTEELLGAKPGSLYKYDNNIVPDESATAWKVADKAVQKAEFVIRGHAAQIPDTLWNRILRGNPMFENDATNNVSPTDRIATMHSIIQRLEEEGTMYMKMRLEVNSQLAVERKEDEESTAANAPKTTTKNEAQGDEEEQPTGFTLEDYASPGATVQMYDTILDSMALNTHADTPLTALPYLQRVVERYHHDGGIGQNLNEATVPTVMSFNTVLRAVANTPYTEGQEEVRDNALQVGFTTYDFMRHFVHRNSATYAYMMQIVAKYIPPSATRGNIAYGMWTQAKKEQVIDQMVIDSTIGAYTPSNGKDFDTWVEETIKDKGFENIPQKLRRNSKSRRHQKQSGIY
mmetsp:Transcript_3430/g.5044  ORF Transcript_3430/g.5044 Transcript_3430/m.5044 type:complete len:422 (-) Transcript_3430:169-1434(-)